MYNSNYLIKCDCCGKKDTIPIYNFSLYNVSLLKEEIPKQWIRESLSDGYGNCIYNDFCSNGCRDKFSAIKDILE
jgi:hypothetical protein